tara:strand:- start:541 stop:1113 length:573 start_codon:yes stop_codon:yes gene_type:complete
LSKESNKKENQTIISGKQFSTWRTLNDTIMGGRSTAFCQSTEDGLSFSGELVSEGGGFVSCRSELFVPAMDLSCFRGLQIDLHGGGGRTLKLAISCGYEFYNLARFLSTGLRWIDSFSTEPEGLTSVNILFSRLKPTVRAKPVKVPILFNATKIKRFQILHSKFGDKGDVNLGFKPGPIDIVIRRISGIK